MGGSSQFFVGFPIADNGIFVHFRAGCRQCQHGHNREDISDFFRICHQIPRVPFIGGASGNYLGCVDNAAASDSKHSVDVMFLAELYAFTDGSNFGIWLHAGQLIQRKAGEQF